MVAMLTMLTVLAVLAVLTALELRDVGVVALGQRVPVELQALVDFNGIAETLVRGDVAREDLAGLALAPEALDLGGHRVEEGVGLAFLVLLPGPELQLS